MLTRRNFLQAGMLISLSSLPDLLLANKNSELYEVLKKSPTGQGVGVMNFFSYACPHCLRFDDVFQGFEKQLIEQGVSYEAVPVLLDPSHLLFSQAYYCFKFLDQLPLQHRSFWEWVILEEHAWSTTADVQKDIVSWVEKRGISKRQWDEACESSFVRSKLDHAQKVVAEVSITSTPCLVVHGKYLTSPAIAGSAEKCIEVVNELLSEGYV